MKKMKNVYVKPEMDVMEFLGEVLMVSASIPGEDNEVTDPAANDHRGSWGNLWE